MATSSKKAKTINVKETEDLSPANLERVISLLEAERPCTKKEACSILNISYNTTRLKNIIDSFKEKKLRTEKLRAEKRNKPATESEIQYSITEYLSGVPVSTIADSLYRSSSLINTILTRCGVPKRSSGWSYFSPELIPEAAAKKEFSIGEKVWSARYQSLATIIIEVPNQPHISKVYRIFLESEEWKQFAYQPAEELASLSHLTKYGVKF